MSERILPSGLQVTGVSTIQWFLMYTNIGKLICYTRKLSTNQGACLEGFHCNIATCSVIILITIELLNQARAGRRPVRAWFLKIDPVRIVCMCVCVCVRPRGY